MIFTMHRIILFTETLPNKVLVELLIRLFLQTMYSVPKVICLLRQLFRTNNAQVVCKTDYLLNLLFVHLCSWNYFFYLLTP